MNEKQNNCPYCHGLIGENKPLDISPNRKARLDVASSGFFEYTTDGLVTHVCEQYFNYCPMCGRDLRSDEKFRKTYREDESNGESIDKSPTSGN